MKVAAAQCASKPGDIVANVRRHVAVVERVAPLEADAVVFPELSLIGYESRFAAATATAPEDPRFAPLQAASERCGILVAVGAPLETPDLPRIATQIFRPFAPIVVHVKRLLHGDEVPWFAREQRLTIVMSSAVGPFADGMAGGRSAAWRPDGTLAASLGATGDGLVCSDTR